MHRTIEFLLHHGYSVLLVWVFAEQIGLPVPSLPLLLAAGALAGIGKMNFFTCLAVSIFASVCADYIWYQMGRLKGIKVLQLLCKISLEPDSCVRKTEGLFSTQGARSLLVAKFLPGFSTVAPPLAGVFHMRPAQFLLYDSGGSAIWAGSFLLLGYVFSGQIEYIAARAATLGSGLLVLIIAFLGGYILYKYIARKRFMRELRIARITVEELKEKMDDGEQVMVVDLRHPLDFDADPETIPGAFRIDAKELEKKNERLPRDREVILYCTCPNEATSARLALLLRRQGVKHIRPLQGGLDAWREQGYPVVGTAPTEFNL